MTPPWLAEIAARCEKATPGPWEVHRVDDEEGDIDYELWTVSGDGVAIVPEGFRAPGLGKQDADFIAHAREDVPRLVEAVKDMHEALIAIAEEDELVKASDGAWGTQAYRRRREIALAALARADAVGEV